MWEENGMKIQQLSDEQMYNMYEVIAFLLHIHMPTRHAYFVFLGGFFPIIGG